MLLQEYGFYNTDWNQEEGRDFPQEPWILGDLPAPAGCSEEGKRAQQHNGAIVIM